MSNQDAPQSLYAAREPIFPRRVKGTFRTLKWWIMGLTLAVYYLTPWIRWDRGPNLPDQAVLIDLAGRRFYFFWIEIWPHEFYFVAGLLIMAGFGLFLFTSALGRVWCGYTCPQTVWTDLFILVERWIEGDRNARVRLWKAKWDARKIRLRVTKWVVWFLIALATGGAWVFYFADAPTLAYNLVTLHAPAIAYTTIVVLATLTFIFGGFMREQVCIYMCPWPRIQAAMMDPDTLTVAYREWRGEPRGKHRKGADADKLGDCIDCMACVNVCPMGIDIRDGQQLECITCALCIDACDDMMEKVGKPRGLIDYLALSDAPREMEGAAPRPIWQHVFRTRTIVYTTLWSLVGIGLLWALFIRSDIGLTVAPDRNPTFVLLSDGSVRNAYTLRIRNLTGNDRQLQVHVQAEDDLDISFEGEVADDGTITAPANATLNLRAFVTADPKDPANGRDRTPIDIWVQDPDNGSRASEETVFNGRVMQ